MTEQVDDEAATRKARGAFFTPTGVARYLSGWAIKSSSDRVLEPSCGDGVFLAAAADCLLSLGGQAPIRAHELHSSSAIAASQLLTERGYPGEVVVGDFLASVAEPVFDAVIGNPPYVRYQGFTGEARAYGFQAALAQGVRLSKLSSSWAPFLVHSAGFLTADGRLALVLPGELLTSNYAQEVRDFLLRRFAEIRIVRIGRHVFPGVQTEALLLLAEGSGGTNNVRFATVTDVKDLPALGFGPPASVAPGERWLAGLTSASTQNVLTGLVESETFTSLSSWGRLSLGAVTGNNKFFALSPEQATNLRLIDSDVVKISPPGSSHLRALRIDLTDHAWLAARGAKTFLFRPTAPSDAAREYISLGEMQGVDQAYKCRVRSPWWRTPLPAPPDLFFTYMNGATPQLATNDAQLHYLNSVHGLYLVHDHHQFASLLALAALNSATALSAELTGRAYGGGILKMEPREAAQLLVPSPAWVRHQRSALTKILPTAKALLEQGKLNEARSLVNNLILARSTISPGDLTRLHEAHQSLSERRSQRAQNRASGRRDTR